MSGPVSCHLPVDASLHSFNSLDYGFGAGESPFLAGSADATCGVAAVRAVSQYLNLEPMRAGVSFADTPGQLAQPAPSEALVARERDAARGDRPWEEQQLGVDALTASGRTGAAEDVSTSHDVAEVRLGLFRTSDTRGAPSIRGFLGHATARGAFSGDKHLTATLRFPPRHDRRIPQAFPPLNFGDLDVEQQADALFSKVRLPSKLPSPRSPRTPRRTTLAPPHVASFSERANTSLRLSIDKKNTPLTPFSSTPRAPRSGRDANQGPMRTLSARTFETLLDESNVRENEVRPGARERAAIRPTARFLVRNERLEPGHPEARVSPRRRRTPPNPGATRGTFLLGTLFRRLFGIFLAQKKSASFALRHALRRGDASTLFLAPRPRIALERARADPRPTSAFSLRKKGVDGASEFAVASARRDGARRG
jgi:hypothetical protein